MTFKDYIQKAKLTESDNGHVCSWLALHRAMTGSRNSDFRLLHTVLGMVSELSELRKAMETSDVVNVKEELGDIFWYLAVGIDACSFDADFVQVNTDNIEPELKAGFEGREVLAMATFNELSCTMSEICNDVKRFLFYGRTFDLKALEHKFYEVSASLIILARLYDLSMEAVLTTNIAKLQKRYPNRFESVKAFERDLSEERKVLETT